MEKGQGEEREDRKQKLGFIPSVIMTALTPEGLKHSPKAC